MTPFGDATALEAVPLQLVLTLFTGKNDMTWARHIRIKRETILTRLTYFLSTSGRVNPVKVKAPVSQEKITNVSKNSTQVVLSIKDNMQCKEGIFNDFLREKIETK